MLTADWPELCHVAFGLLTRAVRTPTPPPPTAPQHYIHFINEIVSRRKAAGKWCFQPEEAHSCLKGWCYQEDRLCCCCCCPGSGRGQSRDSWPLMQQLGSCFFRIAGKNVKHARRRLQKMMSELRGSKDEPNGYVVPTFCPLPARFGFDVRRSQRSAPFTYDLALVRSMCEHCLYMFWSLSCADPKGRTKTACCTRGSHVWNNLWACATDPADPRVKSRKAFAFENALLCTTSLFLDGMTEWYEKNPNILHVVVSLNPTTPR